MSFPQKKKIAIVGGCGHVGLPLGIAFADVGFNVVLVDPNTKSRSMVVKGTLPFIEEKDTEVVLKKVIREKKLSVTVDGKALQKVDIVVFVTGTPVDAHLNPKVSEVVDVIKFYLPYLDSRQLIILRSTIYPDTIDLVAALLKKKIGKHKLAYCPERVAQGYAFSEIKKLPQIISGTSAKSIKEAETLFKQLAGGVKVLTAKEAAIAKLMTNAWRYIDFAIANQFYMLIEEQNLDFYKIYDAVRDGYPRAQNFATAGFAAGPCLFKDTMQLFAFNKGNFFLGQVAMLVNEGLPVFLVEQMEKQLGSLKGKKIAILGMAFKANNDDQRESLSFKLKKNLEMKLAKVLMTDVYDSKLMSLPKVLNMAHGVILGVPHREYLQLKINKPFVDCWGVWRKRG